MHTLPSIPISVKTMSEERTFLVSLADVECIVTRRIDHTTSAETWKSEEVNNNSLSSKVKELLINTLKQNYEEVTK